MNESQKLVLGEKITIRVISGRGGKPIGRLPDGRVILFDVENPFFSMLALGQSVECRVKVIGENYVIVDPIREPEEKGTVHYLEVDVDLIVMGSRGRGGIVGFLGSTSQHVVEACTKPIIIVK